MIYSIETIPMVLFSKLLKGGDLKLLSDELNDDEIKTLWDKIREDYKKHENNIINNKVDSLRIKLSKKEGIYVSVITALDVLKYKKSSKMLDILKNNGYVITGDYEEGLALINKQVINLENFIESIRDEIRVLLKVSDKEVSIYEIIVGLSIGLEIPLETNKVTAIEFIFLSKGLKNKIKVLKND